MLRGAQNMFEVVAVRVVMVRAICIHPSESFNSDLSSELCISCEYLAFAPGMITWITESYAEALPRLEITLHSFCNPSLP